MAQTIPASAVAGVTPTSIASVEAWLCRVPLPRPLELGGQTLTTREYVVVRIAGADGTHGAAFGLTRGAPVDLIVTELLAPGLAGTPLAPAAVAERCRELLVIAGSEGLAQRAASLIEIAAWDAAATAANVPVWRLLAPAAEPAPAEAMLVEGYPLAGETATAFGQRLAAQADAGYRAFKLAKNPDADAMRARLAAARDAVGPEAIITIDALWSWRGAEAAAAEIATWAPYRPEWVEDPFPRERLDWLAQLRATTTQRLAYGDETTRPGAYDRLLEERLVDVVRVDATTIGGLAPFAAVRAKAKGDQTAPHVFPEIHRHLACAWPDVGPIELFRPDAGFDASHRLVAPVGVKDGRIEVPHAPGLGLDVDWEAVEAHSIRHTLVGERP